jgi:L-asparaginase II
VQERITGAVSSWTGVDAARLGFGVDGCTAVSFALPLSAMALAYARLASAPDGPAAAIRQAMSGHPGLVAGAGRCCTDLMAAGGGRLVAKIGAEGVYGAALPDAGLGLALKVASGSMPAAPVALLAVLRLLDDELGLGLGTILAHPAVARHAEVPILDTQGGRTGALQAAGALRFRGT